MGDQQGQQQQHFGSNTDPQCCNRGVQRFGLRLPLSGERSRCAGSQPTVLGEIHTPLRPPQWQLQVPGCPCREAQAPGGCWGVRLAGRGACPARVQSRGSSGRGGRGRGAIDRSPESAEDPRWRRSPSTPTEGERDCRPSSDLSVRRPVAQRQTPGASVKNLQKSRRPVRRYRRLMPRGLERRSLTEVDLQAEALGLGAAKQGRRPTWRGPSRAIPSRQAVDPPSGRNSAPIICNAPCSPAWLSKRSSPWCLSSSPAVRP